MAHAANILQKMADYKCDYCGKPIGKLEAGTQVHVACVPAQFEAEMRKEPRREHER